MYGHEVTAGTSSGCGCGCGGGSTRPKSKKSSGQCGCGCGGRSCDGLTCSCRPRFFDGQLITAADFKRLDKYIVEKSRLHNRYLHGVGVVCGLEAVCNPCDDTVIVRPGYALGPCGEDIVVCEDARVDVAGLIKDHRRATARSDCAPYSDPAQDCESARQKWILAICYDERPVRGAANLKQPGGGCGCGGSGGSCGGGCSGSRSTPSTCEPTQICEGYRFTLTKVPPRQALGDRKYQVEPTGDGGELASRIKACLVNLKAQVTSIPKDPDVAEVAAYCCQLKADLRELAETSSVTDCSLPQRLNAIVCPDVDDPDIEAKSKAAITAMLQIAIDLFRMCACSALLPPCGVEAEDDCVPLAVLTVRSSDMRVLDICNWSARKFAVTMPTLSYWLGWIPIFDSVRSVIERLCCETTRQPAFEIDPNLKVAPSYKKTGYSVGEHTMAEDPNAIHMGTSGAPVPPREAMTGNPQMSVAGLAAQYVRDWTPLSGLEATVLGAMGAENARGEALASGLELDHPLVALALGRVGVSAGQALIPPDLLSQVRWDRQRGGAVGVTEREEKDANVTTGGLDEARLAGLEAAVTKLTKTVNSQARTIKSLREKGPDK